MESIGELEARPFALRASISSIVYNFAKARMSPNMAFECVSKRRTSRQPYIGAGENVFHELTQKCVPFV